MSGCKLERSDTDVVPVAFVLVKKIPAQVAQAVNLALYHLSYSPVKSGREDSNL